ncbi:MAG: winged helix-turn-helix domain-containing protein [Terriglobia bacterium]|jgi:hypothetical protein
MEIKQLIGETAGQVWQVLNSDGPQTLPQLRRKLDGTGPFVDFAVGWLVREEKIDIDQEKKSLRLRLK